MDALTNPPIKEAIIAISFQNPISRDVIEAFCANEFIKNRYSQKQSLVNLTITKKSGAAVDDIATNHSHDGYALIFKDEFQEIIQIKLGGISFHNTGKYLGWDKFYDNFRIIWKIFNEANWVDDAIGINLRYLNEIFIELEDLEGIENYLNLIPLIPNELNSGTDSFFIQAQIPDHNNGLQTVVTENLETIAFNRLKVMLDIQVFPKSLAKIEDAFNKLEAMREIKNRVFKSCLTDKTLKMYE